MKKHAIILICMLSSVLCSTADIDLITVSQLSQQTNSAHAKLFQVSIVPRNAFQGDKILHVNIDIAATNQSLQNLGFLLLDGDTPLVTTSISSQVQSDGVVRSSDVVLATCSIHLNLLASHERNIIFNAGGLKWDEL